MTNKRAGSTFPMRTVRVTAASMSGPQRPAEGAFCASVPAHLKGQRFSAHYLGRSVIHPRTRGRAQYERTWITLQGRSHGGHCPHLLEARPAQRPLKSAYSDEVPAPSLQGSYAIPSEFGRSSAAVPTMGLSVGE